MTMAKERVTGRKGGERMLIKICLRFHEREREDRVE